MIKIYKEELLTIHGQIITISKCSYVLSVGNQIEKPVVWYVPSNTTNPMKIVCLWTGREIEAVGTFLGTIQLINGIVCHYFESVA